MGVSTNVARNRGESKGVLPGAGAALALLLLINLFNYLDRQVLAAVVGPIKATFFGQGSVGAGPAIEAAMRWSQQHLGFKPEDALVGLLGTAFMLVYMIGSPVFARLAERTSRWLLIGIGVILWSLASGASGLAMSFVALLLTRCLVGVGEAAYGPVAPAMIADLYPVAVRGRVLAWFYMAIPVGSALGYVLGAGSGDPGWANGVPEPLGRRPRAGDGPSTWWCRRAFCWASGASSCESPGSAAEQPFRSPGGIISTSSAPVLMCSAPWG